MYKQGMWYRFAKKKSYDNIMIAFYLPKSLAKAMVVKPKELPEELDVDLSPPEDMHMTLVLIDDAKKLESKIELVQTCLEQIASEYSAINGKIGGVGAFMPGGEVSPIYYSFDAPDLPNFQVELKTRLKNLGLPVNEEHGFTPHITIGYTKNDTSPIETLSHIDLSPVDVKFSEMQLRWGNIEKGRYKLTGQA
jgi:2'-5' RNA ligase